MSRVVIVSCPACATRFSVDASLLGPNGRNVRCAKCGHRWHQEPPAPVESLAAEVAANEPAAAPAPEPAPPPQTMAPGLAALLGGQAAATRPAPVVVPPKLKPAAPARKVGMWPWVLLAGIVCGLAVAAYFLRGPITAQLPAAESLYALFGLGGGDAAQQLEIGNLKSEQRSGLIAVRGDVFNPQDVPLKIPPLLLVAFDADQKPVGKPLMFRTQESEIAPGETITFRILYQDAPAAMKSFRVTFGKIDAKSQEP